MKVIVFCNYMDRDDSYEYSAFGPVNAGRSGRSHSSRPELSVGARLRCHARSCGRPCDGAHLRRARTNGTHPPHIHMHSLYKQRILFFAESFELFVSRSLALARAWVCVCVLVYQYGSNAERSASTCINGCS